MRVLDKTRGDLGDDHFPYVDCAVGGTNRRNNVLPLADYSPNGYADCYTTMLRFPESFRAYVEYNDGSVSGYAGQCKADFFAADFDRKDDPAKALEDARQTVRRWEAIYGLPPDALRYYFSGDKGFHIEIPENLFDELEAGRNTAIRLKALARELLKDSKTADFSIYETLRLWRTPNTRHKATGLYKIPLYVSEFFSCSMKEIRELATERREQFVYTDPSEYEAIPELVQLWRNTRDARFDPGEHRERVDTGAILNGVPEGERDNALFKLSCKLRGADVPYDWAERLALEAAANCDPPFPQREALRKVQEVYKRYAPREETEPVDSEFDSDVIGSEFRQNEFLPIKTVAEVLEEVGDGPDWYVEGLLAPGSITELSGEAKLAGKTTLVAHKVSSILKEEPFLGLATRRAKILYLTEQGNNFAEVLRKAGLRGCLVNDRVVRGGAKSASFTPRTASCELFFAGHLPQFLGRFYQRELSEIGPPVR